MRLFEKRMVNKSIYKEESNRMAENVPNEDLHDMCSSPIRNEMVSMWHAWEKKIYDPFFTNIWGMKSNRVLKKWDRSAWIGFVGCG